MTDSNFVPVPGSGRLAMPHAQPAGELDETSRIEVTVLVRRKDEPPDELVQGPDTISQQELAERYGADPADLALVGRVLTGRGLEIVATDPASRRVTAAGSPAAMAAAFGTRLVRASAPHPYRDGTIEYRCREGELRIPAELSDVVTAVLGLDDRPQARSYLISPAAAGGVSYTPPQLGTVYRFPAGTDGTGQTIAIIELGGGFRQQDLDQYFKGLGLKTPDVKAVAVDGGKNAPGDPNGADGEVLLDIEVVGGLAPGATQLVYFAPNTDKGFVDALSAAIHAKPTPIAVSISWGAPEERWTAQARQAFDAVLADAATLGVTVTAAAGDDGSSDRMDDGKAHTDFPAASPHILACGGTRLDADGQTGQVRSETVWNEGADHGATGGGVSTAFPLPPWQATAGVPDRAGGGTGRGVPDVAADADPATGYQVLIDGKAAVIGGTSAVAPLWAALVARLAQATGRRFGLLQPTLYQGAAKDRLQPGFRDVTSGDNTGYRATPGWDACTGLGVPDGTALLGVLKKK